MVGGTLHIVIFRADLIVTANLNVVPVTGSKPGNTGYMLASFREYCTAPLRKILKTARQYREQNHALDTWNICYSSK